MRTTGISFIEAMDNRFPCKPIIRFTKAHTRQGAIISEGKPDFDEFYEMYGGVKVPHEIVRHIYEAGWADAQRAAIEALSNCTQG